MPGPESGLIHVFKGTGKVTTGNIEPVKGIKLSDGSGTGIAVVGQDGGNLLDGVSYDFIDIQQTNATTETYVYKTGGSGGTVTATVVIVYTDATKKDLDTVTRT